MRDPLPITIGASSYLKGRIGWQGLRAAEFTEEGPYLITGTDFSNGHILWDRCYHVTEERFAEAPYIHVADGDLLITKDGTIGKVAYVEGCPSKAVLNSGIFLLRCKDGSYRHRYAYYVLTSFLFDRFLRQSLSGSTINHLYQQTFVRFELPRVPIAVQDKVTTILSAADRAIEKTEALIDKYQQIKAGLMHDLFTRGVLPTGHPRPSGQQAPELYRQTPIGPIPKDWRLSNCGEMFSIDSGITLGPHRTPAKRSHPYLRVANVHRAEIRLDDVAQLEVMPGELQFALRKDDLLLVEGHANRSEIGRCAMVPDEAVGMLFQNHLFRLRPIGMDVNYALLWMNSYHARHYWESACATSSGLNTINRNMLARMTVCVPDQSEQRAIATAGFALTRALDSAQRQLAKLRSQKLGLMQDLLTGKVPVKVDEPIAETADA